ncbi:response regulator transcription factor [Vitiosangium sp. GDMCC 1.1324]|uniref:response regulator transcription factor n=1 Tax=Vitiosangium sp. (strain GDMCC 1.1324) TaxID=2138576 RepID=UPI000D347561|nr:response regulator transcription factor [Vitiosangium sp. GDMCC 1.1324]PTL80031.1 DNA-binding response regulator [Vitiosangium sp. GDMCC 1.1324]
MEAGRIRVGILEDHQIFRESLVVLFESSGMEVVAQGPDEEGFLAQLQEAEPDVALVDLRLERPDSAEVGDGVRVVELLRERHPRIRSLILSAYRDQMLLERCFQAGAAGYLCKLNVGSTGLVSAVEQVARGEWLVPPELVSPVQAAQGGRNLLMERLTLREREVLGLVAAGADNLQISARLGITERTVKAHVSNLYRKLAVHNRVEMARLAYQSGLSSPVDAQPS